GQPTSNDDDTGRHHDLEEYDPRKEMNKGTAPKAMGVTRLLAANAQYDPIPENTFWRRETVTLHRIQAGVKQWPPVVTPTGSRSVIQPTKIENSEIDRFDFVDSVARP
ncbi:hypothetical protein HPB47_022288, partial [Ixodes persulcatus]